MQRIVWLKALAACLSTKKRRVHCNWSRFFFHQCSFMPQLTKAFSTKFLNSLICLSFPPTIVVCPIFYSSHHHFMPYILFLPPSFYALYFDTIISLLFQMNELDSECVEELCRYHGDSPSNIHELLHQVQ